MSEDPASYETPREPTTRVQFVLPVKKLDALKRAALADGVTLSQVLRWAVDDFLANRTSDRCVTSPGQVLGGDCLYGTTDARGAGARMQAYRRRARRALAHGVRLAGLRHEVRRVTTNDSWDLDEPAPERAPPDPDLTEDVRAVIAALRAHPLVRWAERVNVGAFAVERKDRLGTMRRSYVRCGFAGLSDIIGQLRDGRFLAVEAKRRKGGKVSAEQREFIARVAECGGVAFVARSATDVKRNLETPCAN